MCEFRICAWRIGLLYAIQATGSQCHICDCWPCDALSILACSPNMSFLARLICDNSSRLKTIQLGHCLPKSPLKKNCCTGSQFEILCYRRTSRPMHRCIAYCDFTLEWIREIISTLYVISRHTSIVEIRAVRVRRWHGQTDRPTSSCFRPSSTHLQFSFELAGPCDYSNRIINKKTPATAIVKYCKWMTN